MAFACSAAAPAIRSAIACLRPQGRLIQVGVAGDPPAPLNMPVGQEFAIAARSGSTPGSIRRSR